jgi:AbrB family looped-hinge helix DNA binding protein
MPDAKITSKGQVTIPAEVREALGLKKGDMLAFEVQAEYVVVRRRLTAAEVAAHLDAEGPWRLPGGMTEDEAVAEYFDKQWDAGWGKQLYVVGAKDPRK